MNFYSNRTENDMGAYSSSGHPVLDAFYRLPGMRGYDQEAIASIFRPAFLFDPLMAMQLLFYIRDFRNGGAGERSIFRTIVHDLLNSEGWPWVDANLEAFPKYGRWDDLIDLVQYDNVGEDATRHIVRALADGNGLCAKWFPREGKSRHHVLVKFLQYHYGYKMYWDDARKKRAKMDIRKIVNGLSNTVEQKMSLNKWEEIHYGKDVPGQAMTKYFRAFWKHDPDRFEDFLDAVDEGTATLKTSTLMPYEIVREIQARGGDRLLEAQWRDYLDNLILRGNWAVVLDVSDSMYDRHMSIWKAMSSALAIASKSTTFKNRLITFSARPQLVKIPLLSLADQITYLMGLDWGRDTNLELTAKKIVEYAQNLGIPKGKMVDYLIILSDMQFNKAINGYGDITDDLATVKAVTMLKEIFTRAGYDTPTLVFWNNRTSQGVPATQYTNGVIMVSGYNPKLLETVMGAETPLEAMLKTISKYEVKAP